MSLHQLDRKRVLRYTRTDRRAVYRKVFGYTNATPPHGAEPNFAFHTFLSNFCQHVSRFFEDKRVSEVLRPSGTQETFGSMAVVRRSGLDLRANLKQVSYGHVAVSRIEMSGLLAEAFDVLGSADVVNLFGADNAWDVLEEVLKCYLREIPVASQRSLMATTGRDILRWLAEDYLFTSVRIDFGSLLRPPAPAPAPAPATESRKLPSLTRKAKACFMVRGSPPRSRIAPLPYVRERRSGQSLPAPAEYNHRAGKIARVRRERRGGMTDTHGVLFGPGVVRSRRLELPRPFGHNDLNVARLPVPPRPHVLPSVEKTASR